MTVLERLAGHVLHDDEEDVVDLLGGENRHHIRVVERAQEPRLFQHLAEIEVLLVRNLEGDLLVDPGVFGQVYRAETATAEGRKNAVLTDSLTAKEHDR